ncbi:luciferase family protein [Halorubrum sp. HHNYT27]|uniref:luciferase domain-containing protein n=1 Tax=Halorubrum sp. HHNYT27 TaxID=3402275 RepID=UPI003EBBC242
MAECVQEIIDELSLWSHVHTDERRSGSTEFRLGPRSIGHVHRWGIVDIAFPVDVRNHLIEVGRTDSHYPYPQSGWTTFYLESKDDVDTALQLLRLSYLIQIQTLKRSPAGRSELADIDVPNELATLDISDDLREMIYSQGE